MNPNACEFLPQHKNPVIDQIHNTLFGLVYDYFRDDNTASVSQMANKLIVILDHQSKLTDSLNAATNLDANPPIAKALVSLMVSKANRITKGMPFMKEICESLSDATYNALMQAVQNQIYLFIHAERVKAMLLQMSQGESLPILDEQLNPVTKENIENLPIYLPELVNLMIELVLYMFEKRRRSEDRLIGPNQTCMDLLYLSDCVFRLQMQHSGAQLSKELEAASLVNGDEVKMNRASYLASQVRKKGVTEWYEFFCLVCEALSKVTPVINYILLCSNESILNGAWSHSVSLTTRQNVLKARLNECAFFSIENLGKLFDSTLTRLRELIVQPELLNKWHARSTALDTVLIAASLPSPSFMLPSQLSQGSDSTPDDELTQDDPHDDYSADYERFLASLPEDAKSKIV